jgi:hypothetical protein
LVSTNFLKKNKKKMEEVHDIPLELTDQSLIMRKLEEYGKLINSLLEDPDNRHFFDEAERLRDDIFVDINE